jgi:hypothetical protein
MRTYTLATTDDVLFVCLPDEADVISAITEATCTAYGAGTELSVMRGTILTDGIEPGDEVVWMDSPDGNLKDSAGKCFRYAVRRSA